MDKVYSYSLEQIDSACNNAIKIIEEKRLSVCKPVYYQLLYMAVNVIENRGKFNLINLKSYNKLRNLTNENADNNIFAMQIKSIIDVIDNITMKKEIVYSVDDAVNLISKILSGNVDDYVIESDYDNMVSYLSAIISDENIIDEKNLIDFCKIGQMGENYDNVSSNHISDCEVLKIRGAVQVFKTVHDNTILKEKIDSDSVKYQYREHLLEGASNYNLIFFEDSAKNKKVNGQLENLINDGYVRCVTEGKRVIYVLTKEGLLLLEKIKETSANKKRSFQMTKHM